jgi:hypothetical protein
MATEPMRPSPSPFGFAQRLDPRERRTVLLGAIVSVVAVVVAFGVVPFVERWSAREQAIDAARDQVARLRYVIEHERELRASVERVDQGLAGTGGRLLTGRTPALAASSLQTLIQGYADQSRVTINRLDVAGAPDTISGALPSIPATLSAIGDIYGMTDLLTLIENGPRLLEITELTVVSNSALRGGLLQISMGLRAAYAGGSGP